MKKILYLLIFSFLGLTVSCSDKDEPADNNQVNNGVQVYLNAVEKLYKSDGTPAFTPTERTGVYVASATDYQQSYNYICNLIEDSDWDGKDISVSLGKNGENGELKVIGQNASMLQQGVYNKIIVDIKDYTPYTLEIITEEMADNGYVGDGVVVKL